MMAKDNCTAIVKCGHCNSLFEKVRKGGRAPKYCSKKCRIDHEAAYNSNKRRRKKVCVICKSKFNNVGRKIYCSTKCRNRAQTIKDKLEGRVRAKRLGKRNCKTCGLEFEAYEGKREKYCSKICDQKDASRRLNERKNESFLKKHQGKFSQLKYCSCILCDKIYFDRPRKVQDGFCSTQCHHKFKETYKEFYYRWERGFALTGLRVCPETKFLFRPTSTKQKYLNYEVCKAVRARKGVAKRRAMLRGVKSEVIDPFDVFEGAKWHCQACGKSTPKERRGTKEHDAPELDHIIPVSKGGAHVRENVQLLCKKCNAEKSDKMPFEWMAEINPSNMEARNESKS
jgi:hypothetical protein